MDKRKQKNPKWHWSKQPNANEIKNKIIETRITHT